jgi:hypothetical protein
MRKGNRAAGVDRSRLAAELKKRYEEGESIRSLAAATGRSYGFVHRILSETGVSLRGRGGATRGKFRRRGIETSEAFADGAQPEISIQVFLTDESAGPAVEEALRDLLFIAGFEDVHESQLIIGSWYHSLTGLLKRTGDSNVAAEARRAVELQVLDRFQAGVDGVTSDAVAKLITALNQTKGAVIQVGSVLLVKVDDTIVVRQLTPREMTHWQDNPGLFKDPRAALPELQRAGEMVDQAEELFREAPEQRARPA